VGEEPDQLPTTITMTPEEAAEQALAEFKAKMKVHRRFILIKLGLYLGEIAILTGIIAWIDILWVSLIVGIIGGVLIASLTTRLFKRLHIQETAGQSATEASKSLVLDGRSP